MLISTLYLKLIWLAVAIVFGILEVMTVGLTMIWFSIGAIAAMITSSFTDSLIIQILVFLIVSIVMLVLATKGIIMKDRKDKPYSRTNVDALVGKKGICKEKVEKYKTGTCVFDGEEWTAISIDGEEIQAGDEVVVEKIEGVKAIVRKK